MVQYDTNEGPCLTTFSTADTIRLDMLDSDERFPLSTTSNQAQHQKRHVGPRGA
jgi:hypothetical protein